MNWPRDGATLIDGAASERPVDSLFIENKTGNASRCFGWRAGQQRIFIHLPQHDGGA